MKLHIITMLVLHLLSAADYSQAEQTAKTIISNGNSILTTPSQMKKTYIQHNQLQTCPDKPNCINTEYPDKVGQYLSPLSYPEEKSDQIIILAKNIIIAMGGKIINEDDAFKNKNYLHATFTSSVFRFIDDFEIRIDNLSQKLHIRSASRTGYSDFGVNKRRVEKFSTLFTQALKKTIKEQ